MNLRQNLVAANGVRGFLFHAAWAMMLVVPLAIARRRPDVEDGPAAQLSKAPASARALRNPFDASEAAALAGRKLYVQHCAACHGRDGFGTGHAANLHSRTIQTAAPGALFWALRNGRIRKGMPSWSQLPDQQLWQLVTYLETLK